MEPELLKRARAALGYSQQELADDLNVRKATVYRWEKGRMAVGSPSRLKDTLLALLDEREREIHDVRERLLLHDTGKTPGGNR